MAKRSKNNQDVSAGEEVLQRSIVALVNGHDPLVDQRSRLGILTRLRPCAEGADPDRPYRELRRASGLSDSNFHNHLKKLRNAFSAELIAFIVLFDRRSFLLPCRPTRIRRLPEYPCYQRLWPRDFSFFVRSLGLPEAFFESVRTGGS